MNWLLEMMAGRSLSSAIGVGIMLLAAASFAGSGLVLAEWTPIEPTLQVQLVLLYANLAVLLLVGAVLARRIATTYVKRRRELAGARLHGRLVFLFGLLTIIPAILVAGSSIVFLHFGIEAWFQKKVSTAVRESRVVAEAYLEEHLQAIRGAILEIAVDLQRAAPFLSRNPPEQIKGFVATQRSLRSLTDLVIFDGSGRIVARSTFTFLEPGPPDIPVWASEQARQGDIVVMRGANDDVVNAVMRINEYQDIYLFVSRLVDSRVLTSIEQTAGAVDAYERLEEEKAQLQLASAGAFGVLSVLLLIGAIGAGVSFATHLFAPINDLVGAAERVRDGDLSARVPERTEDDELSILARTFNGMLMRQEAQHVALKDANQALDQRTRFTEAVLAGVPSGVLGLDALGQISLPNDSATVLLETTKEALVGSPLEEVIPNGADLIDQAKRRPLGRAEMQIQMRQAGRGPRTLIVHITTDRTAGEIAGFVVTFDDITELMAAQRKAAWADVARRIAHEIKNPLTPIQLSAERLKRRYLKEIESDPETFSACTDTIVRQVGDIERMVNEFSAFARMPAPSLREVNLVQICREAVVLQRGAHPEITFHEVLPEERVPIRCDRQQVAQALTNLVQNAIDAVAAKASAPGMSTAWPGQGARGQGATGEGEVRVVLERHEDAAIVAVEDNGIGLPDDERERLTEPYVTTKTKGTGLGLAIVRKIMEDHGGELLLEDRSTGGTRAALVFKGVDADHPDGGNEPTNEADADGSPRTGKSIGDGVPAVATTRTIVHGA